MPDALGQPEQTSGWLSEQGSSTLCHDSIYQMILAMTMGDVRQLVAQSIGGAGNVITSVPARTPVITLPDPQ